tara:strand:- start:2711 stop:3466 length:756 start_codon:yes stop_codon:yes gene_type:complete
MKEQFHILNGDALKDQFPKELSENIIVARECLIEGDLRGSTLDIFFQTRSKFIADTFEEASVEGYFENVVSEFEKIKHIPKVAEINLWFEDDLFCQANFWFTVHLLLEFEKDNSVFLVRPRNLTQYGFGAYSVEGLKQLFKERIRISDLKSIQRLWNNYQNGATIELLNSAKILKEKYPFVIDAVKAHVDRIPTKDLDGKPKRVLREIIKEKGSTNFSLVFREFNKSEYIYGFGDVQVKRLFDEITSENNP